MKRKTYKTPTTRIVFLKHQSRLLSGSPKASLKGEETAVEQDWS